MLNKAGFIVVIALTIIAILAAVKVSDSKEDI